MKRFWVTLLVVCMTLCVFACGEKKQTKNPQDNQDENSVVRDMGILSNKQKADEEGVLWYVPNEKIEASLQQELRLYCNDLLLFGSKYNETEGTVLEITTISLETGKVMQSKSISGIELAGVQVCGEHVVVSDWMKGDVFVLNQTLEIVETYKKEGHTTGAIYMSPDLQTLFCFGQEKGISVKNIKDGSEKVLLENTNNLLPGTVCGNYVSVSYTDKETQMVRSAIVDLENGTTQIFPFEGAFYGAEYEDGIWFGCAYSETDNFYIGQENHPNTFSLQEGSGTVSLMSGPTRLMTDVYEQSGATYLTMYETDGRFLSKCTLDMEGAALFYDPAWSSEAGGYFFTVTDSSGVDRLMFWDFSVPTSGKDLTLTSVAKSDEVEEDGDVSANILQEVKEIEEKFNVEIKVGTQCLTQYDEYSIETVTDETYIVSALQTLEQALASYPNGFMQQLLYGTQTKTEIHLVKELIKQDIPENANGFSSFVGFASEAEGMNLILLDIVRTGSLEQTIYHEINHIIENKLKFDANVRENALFSEEDWNKLNPSGFGYAEDYHNIPMSFYGDGFDSSFIDIYSRTYAMEDRARIMEYAMVEADWAFTASEGRTKKLEYWSQCIRDAFDTSGWPKVTKWEKVLQR